MPETWTIEFGETTKSMTKVWALGLKRQHHPPTQGNAVQCA